MASLTRTPLPLSTTIRILVTLVSLAVPFTARASDASDSARAVPPTHRQFVDSCLADLAGSLLAGFTPNRSQPIVVIPDTSDDSARALALRLAEILSDRGLLIRDPTSREPDAGNWSLHYKISPLELALTEPQRRAFLGRIWVKRTLHAGLQMNVRDESEGVDLWTDSADSTYFDWVAKRELQQLESDEFSPVAPREVWEKAKVPLIMGGTVVVVGVLLLTLR